MTNKTPLQELIERSKEALRMIPNKNRFDAGVKFATETIINTATELLEKEKNIIQDAYLEGWTQHGNWQNYGEKELTDEQYFNQTFKQ